MTSDLVSRVAETLGNFVSAGDRLVVGLSGGVDSVVLLDVLARLARRGRFELSAIHVNHQLSPNAPRWAAFCRKLCRTRGISLRVAKVTVARGDSVEAAARAARYEAFRKLRADYIALAHNQDDQAETLLLQLLRGAGVKGLAAMPLLKDERGTREPFVRASEREGAKAECRPPDLPTSRFHELRGLCPSLITRQPSPAILRPLLDVPRSEIEHYARQRKLEWVEDETNTDPYFLRNFLRRDVLPVIATRYPAYRATLARSARNLADAAQLLDELGATDAAGCLENGTLAVAALRRFAPARARNLLRYFLSMQGVTMPGADRLDEALRQAVTAKQDARVLVELGGARLRRFAGRLHVVRETGPLPASYVKPWRGEREVALPGLGGVLMLARGRGAGISLARLRGRRVTIGVRRGGERYQPDCGRPRRSLKNLFQEAQVPPWQRERTPLIFCDGELVWAAGVGGVDCAYRAVGDEPALRPVWQPFAEG
ncbi:MAG: tRNA lysidine(34) synthetase TilS [Betaproteobacteria bacterium]|nr:tRNA lysidine(34) synthetase TilS [Betaproteobacteria bacterium]